MKRDMDLVRRILFAVEDSEDGNVDLDNIGYDRDQIYLHVELMKEHGLVDALIAHGGDGPGHRILACRIRRLTWEGHDFLDMARRDDIWERAKKMCVKVSGGLALGVSEIPCLGCLGGVCSVRWDVRHCSSSGRIAPSWPTAIPPERGHGAISTGCPRARGP